MAKHAFLDVVGRMLGSLKVQNSLIRRLFASVELRDSHEVIPTTSGIWMIDPEERGGYSIDFGGLMTWKDGTAVEAEWKKIQFWYLRPEDGGPAFQFPMRWVDARILGDMTMVHGHGWTLFEVSGLVHAEIGADQDLYSALGNLRWFIRERQMLLTYPICQGCMNELRPEMRHALCEILAAAGFSEPLDWSEEVIRRIPQAITWPETSPDDNDDPTARVAWYSDQYGADSVDYIDIPGAGPLFEYRLVMYTPEQAIDILNGHQSVGSESDPWSLCVDTSGNLLMQIRADAHQLMTFADAMVWMESRLAEAARTDFVSE